MPHRINPLTNPTERHRIANIRADYLAGMSWTKLRKKHHVSTRRLGELCYDLIGGRRKDGRLSVTVPAEPTRIGPRSIPTPVPGLTPSASKPAVPSKPRFLIAYTLAGASGHESHFKVVDEGTLAVEFLQIRNLSTLAHIYVGEVVEIETTVRVKRSFEAMSPGGESGEARMAG